MKAIKALGPTTLVLLTGLALLYVSPAMGETTALCQEDEWTCEKINLIKHVHEMTLEGQKATLLNSISNVLCDGLFLGDVISANSLSEGKLEILGNLAFASCVDEKPNPCTLTEVSEHIILKVLRGGNEFASLTGEGEVKVQCNGISCVYNGAGLLAVVFGPLEATTEENGETVISEQEVHKVKGLLCPGRGDLDLVLTPLVPTYISA